MQTAKQLMKNPESHALWCYGDEMMGELMLKLDTTVFIMLGRLTKLVASESFIRKLALEWADASPKEDDYDYGGSGVYDSMPSLMRETKGQVDLMNQLVQMRVPSFEGILFSFDEFYDKVYDKRQEIVQRRMEREKESDTPDEICYCYTLRSRYTCTPTGELMWGYSWEDGHITTFCYGREQLKKRLTADMQVVSAKLCRNCKPQHPLP